MNYQETLNFIYSKGAKGRVANLNRVKWCLDQLGNPQHQFPAVHIVGTNGKGSTTSYLQHIFTEAGYQVGTFTSPYITRFNERIAICGEEIPDADLTVLLNSILPTLENLKETTFGDITEFELVTILMFQYFAQKNVDIAFIEAGIGGLYDATNVFMPLVVICTSISLDHEDKLGKSHLSIAKHKIGVLKDHVPLLFGPVSNDVRQLFYNTAYNHDSLTFEAGQDFKLSKDTFTYHDIVISPIHLQLLGQHQKINASLAAMCSLILSENFPKISLKTIKQGLNNTKWPGRSELLRPNLLLDGAHNSDGIKQLLTLLQDHYPSRKVKILFAGLGRKSLSPLLNALSDYPLSVTSFDFFEAQPLNQYPDHFNKVKHFEDWYHEEEQETLFVVTGSLYFISEIRQKFIP